MTREATSRVLEEIAEGLLSRDMVILACVNYMSEDDVADMARINGFWDNEEEEEDDED